MKKIVQTRAPFVRAGHNKHVGSVIRLKILKHQCESKV